MYNFYLGFYYKFIFIQLKQNIMLNSLNSVTWYIPPDLGRCRNHIYLDVIENNLIGSIPSNIGDFKQLRTISLAINNLAGKFCDRPTKLSHQTLRIHNQVANIWVLLILMCNGWSSCKSIPIKAHTYKQTNFYFTTWKFKYQGS